MLWLLFVLLVVGCVEGECPGEDLSLAPHPFPRPKNLPVCEKSYHGPNCTCPSSLFECACHKFGRCKVKPGCIRMPWINDLMNDCGDWSDEFNDICPESSFQCGCYNTTCKSSTGCLMISVNCNGKIECPDGSDEVNCTCPVNHFECPCYKTKNCTSVSGCLSTHLRCNGVDDCGDWSDEANCTCSPYTIECACYKTLTCTSLSDGCLPDFFQCNEQNDCGDWSDEINCTCPAEKFECPCYKTKNCTLNYGCIDRYWQCDGRNTCGDWSDEVDCTCPADKFQCDCYKTRNCTSLYGGCLFQSLQCNGKNDCGDWSDEVNCTCPGGTFQCDCYKTHNCTSLYGGCLSTFFQCNKQNDCGDWSDEVNCTCPTRKFECACVGTKLCDISMEGSCIDRSMLCDGISDCRDGSDESQHTCNCSGVYARCPCDPGNKRCPPTGRCIPFNWLNDDFTDCSDGSDEVCFFSNFTYSSNSILTVTCKSEQLASFLVHSTVPPKCNRVIQSLCATDINSCETEKVVCFTAECKTSQENCRILFACENQQLLPYTYFCDGLSNFGTGCSDKSDEIREGFGFKCSGPSRQGVCVLPQVNVYDSMAQCSDGSDLCFVKGQFRCFQCLDKKLIISPKQVCDGVVDCFDMSDECLCSNQSLCDEIRGICPPNQMLCHDSSVCLDQTGVLCNASLQCNDKINTKYCLVQKRLAVVVIRDNKVKKLMPMMCDGKINDDLGLVGEANCPNMFYCFSSNAINIKISQVCDGKVDCHDSSDEFFELCQNTRYYCTSNERLSIDKKHVCDGIIDCDNESDESKCRCESKRFYCTNKQPLSVEWKLVQNGIQDCSDGSDECVNLAGDAFADVNEMIANSFYRAIFWITAMLALGGNSFVFVATIHSLYKANRGQSVFINTSVFILNLSFSDFLMGIYLLAVVVQGTRFSGKYCLFDRKWRSSSLCSGLGALAVLSSEASAFTMTAMTTFRLVSVFKPFIIQSVGVSKILVAEMFCWISSIFLATLPLLNVTSQKFVTDVWFPNNFFETDFISRKNISLLAEKIANSKLGSWMDAKEIITKAFPHNGIKGEFGYYGETSVCMPRLFSTPSEFAWEYSIFLITINFLMFIYMVIAYILIYKQSNRMNASRSTDVSSKMQKRISRLILTDFCCWIPICVMGFLSVGGIKMPPDAYVLSACLLLPINSALNPLLYSKAIENQLGLAKNWLASKIQASQKTLSNIVVRYNANAEGDNNRVIEIME